MQFQADILGVELVRPSIEEVSALGAAYLAGLGTGVWDGLDSIEAAWRAGRVFRPEMPATDRQRLIKEWRTAVRWALTGGVAGRDEQADFGRERQEERKIQKWPRTINGSSAGQGLRWRLRDRA